MKKMRDRALISTIKIELAKIDQQNGEADSIFVPQDSKAEPDLFKRSLGKKHNRVLFAYVFFQKKVCSLRRRRLAPKRKGS